ncbi:ATP-dependent DNA helicase PcrA [Planctomycetes bacterium Poly30]|uniref:DNA 3'-5' helicase n=1 Tax=Saltatorellus ferox TaxID=2528018 RepID=A0A518EXY8_9BACT|nr:ATP-dependent DNA helicase PcrA [Planctomycetes bacterium Poly30]
MAREPDLPPATGAIGGAHLDHEQRAAVHRGGGPTLVVAGPGSGKTRVITERIARLLREGTPPDRIACMTFTRRAAGSMAERVERLVPGRRHQPWITTFHSVALRILRQEADSIEGLTRSFSIYDGAAQARVIRKALSACGLEVRLHPAHDVLDRIQRARRAENPATHPLGPYTEVAQLYEEHLAKANAVDFDGLLIHSARLLAREAEVRERWAGRFEHLLIDEFQDTNEVQLRLASLLGSVHGNVFAVGDPDQSIYAWRGATPDVMLRFQALFEGCATIKLQHNYRSSANILEAADALMAEHQKLPRRLLPTRESGEAILSMALKDAHHEARAIGKVIQNLKTDGQSLSGIGVLYRTHMQQRAIESLFARWKIAFHVVGATEFLERREIQDLLAYLRLIDNPRDEDAFWRAIQAPKRGVGELSAKRLQAVVDEANMDVFWKDRTTLPEAIQSTRVTGGFKGRTREGLESFSRLLEDLAPLASETAARALRAIIDALEPLGWIDAMPGGEGRGDRRSSLEELLSAADDFHERYPDDGISGFLGDVAIVRDLEPDADGEPHRDARAAARDAVQLMTLHAAKGLEFKTVFITGLEEELLPHLRALHVPENGELEEESDEIAEERRLFFVGLTRAKDQVFLTRARSRVMYGNARPSRTSRFHHELPTDLVDILDPEHLDALAIEKDAPPGAGFAVGDAVSHGHYGPGRVVAFAGRDFDARVLVHFEDHGVKELFLQHTSLRREQPSGEA